MDCIKIPGDNTSLKISRVAAFFAVHNWRLLCQQSEHWYICAVYDNYNLYSGP